MENDTEARTIALEGIGLLHEALNNNAPLLRKTIEEYNGFTNFVVKFKLNEARDYIQIDFIKSTKQ